MTRVDDEHDASASTAGGQAMRFEGIAWGSLDQHVIAACRYLPAGGQCLAFDRSHPI
jgi:hypothetical protein